MYKTILTIITLTLSLWSSKVEVSTIKLPIAMAIGTGTQIIQDLAIAIMGGLLFAILVNLYIIPLLFYFLRGRG